MQNLYAMHSFLRLPAPNLLTRLHEDPEFMGFEGAAQPMTTNFVDYLLPAAPEIPPIGVHLVAYPSSKNPLGVKGIGESGTVPAAPAIISGIEDALRDYDVCIEETPIKQARLFQLIQASRRSPTDG